jgi:hypothetical protein
MTLLIEEFNFERFYERFEEGLEWSLQAAREGNLKAKADTYRLSSALGKVDANDELHISRLVT